MTSLNHPAMQRIQYSSYGGPELMRVEGFALAAPGKGEVAVTVSSRRSTPSTGNCATVISK